MTTLRALASTLREKWRRAVENWRICHVPRRCRAEGCDCPCGYCRFDRRHVPGRGA